MNRRNEMVKFSVLLALTVIAYMPAFIWMWDRWFAAESYYSHGLLIPFISVYFVWQKREALKSVEWSNCAAGLFIVSAGLLLHIVCAALRIYFLSALSFVFALYGLVLFSFGTKAARNLLFPVSFLFMMVPLPLVLIGNLTVRLKLFVARCSTLILNNIGFPSVQDGSIIRMPDSYIMVEAPCSGLRSLISLLTLGLLFVYAMKASYLKKGLLLLSVVPIAFMVNIFRTTLIAVVNDLYGTEFAMGRFHDLSGFLMFGVAFLCLYFTGKSLSDSGRRAEGDNRTPGRATKKGQA